MAHEILSIFRDKDTMVTRDWQFLEMPTNCALTNWGKSSRLENSMAERWILSFILFLPFASLLLPLSPLYHLSPRWMRRMNPGANQRTFSLSNTLRILEGAAKGGGRGSYHIRVHFVGGIIDVARSKTTSMDI